MRDAPPPVVFAAAPLRIDLAGSGGLPTVAAGRPSAAVTVALSLNVRAEIRLGGQTIRLSALDEDERVTVSSPAAITYDGRLDRHKAALNMMPVTGGIELLTSRDVPGAAGLGADTAANVAMVAALAHCRRERYAPSELATFAVALEREELGRPGNPIDAWAAAIGGALEIRAAGEDVETNLVTNDSTVVDDLARHLVLVPLSRSRAGGIGGEAVARALAAGDAATAEAVGALEDLVAPAVTAVSAGAARELTGVFDQAWAAQRRLDAALSAAPMRSLEERLRAAGAWAWKLTTGSGGGSLLVLCDPAGRGRVETAARTEGCVPCIVAPGDGVRVWEEAEP